MKVILFLLLALTKVNINSGTTLNNEIKYKLHKVLDFIEEKYDEFHFDGLFGVTFAHAFLIKSVELTPNKCIKLEINKLINKSIRIHNKIYPLLPNHPEYMISFRNNLLDARIWAKILPDKFIYGDIKDMGYYKNWTEEKIIKNKEASYKGIKSDVCLREILEMSSPNERCHISKICEEMMLDGSRIDTGYLLTHRLLYLQIIKLRGCTLPKHLNIQKYKNTYCSYIHKEATTSEKLNFPHYDIFLEQVVLCGMEGYAEFFNIKWLDNILKWQNSYGCYENIKQNIARRTSFEVDFGCSDHTTGLGAAALALHLRFILHDSFVYPS